MVFLCESGCFGAWSRGRYPFVLQHRLGEAFKQFGVWKKQNRHTTTQARFTCSRLHRFTRADYPALQSKGIAGKRLSFWLADAATFWATRPGASDLDKLVATTAVAYKNFLQLLSEYPLVLSERMATEIYKAGQLLQELIVATGHCGSWRRSTIICTMYFVL